MLKFALKHMRVRIARVLLVMLSIVISASVALLAYNIGQQVNEGIISTAAYYDMIIGPAGSSTQLAMNTMFFTDTPLGTIPYSYVEELRKSGLVNEVVPFTMGDSYNSSRIVGTTAAFLNGKELKEGDMFSDVYEAVLGYEVANRYGLKIGDEMITSHGLTSAGTEHASSPLKVVGILSRTMTAYDNAVFTSYKTVWAVHEHEEDHEEEHGEEDEDEVEPHEGEVCAILVKSKGFSEYYRLLNYYSSDSRLLCINPATALREVLDSVDLSSRIVYLLCGVILLMNILVITVITLLNMINCRPEINLMRLIGISMKRIACLYMIQNGITGLAACALALVTAHLCISLMSGYVAGMGIVLNSWSFYPFEWAIAALVFIISVLPTLISILRMSSRDGMDKRY